SGSSGGGSFGGVGLALLAGMGWMRRKAQSK
ncbi:MAG: GlyGly-CTERM sorting domain-containing protein, partial [Aeromonadaceae bacterium]|nr:GlyGly-CTERM sorting domain-containing protein [Aeromonadaceae bacterium]